LQLDINDSIEELQSLHKERRLVNRPSVKEEGTSSPPTSKGTSSRKAVVSTTKEKKSIPNTKKQQPKPTIRSIVQMPVGKLTTTNLNSLCNSIRHHRKGSSFNNLRVLERILLELDHPQNSIDNKVYLKKIHVFSLLTALSKDVKALKQKERRKYNNRDKPSKIGQSDVQRLVNVVSLLSKLRHCDNIDHQCYSKDVPSFATMIASELSRVESSAVNAALLFLNMVDKEEGSSDYWDPRLIGAVLDALARVGRAEDAQNLLEQAIGVCISSVNSKVNSTEVADITSTKRLDIAYASPCYDALLRAYSKKAEYQNTKTKSQSSYRNIPISAISSLSQARHILLNHLPTQPELTITNKTCTAVLQGYATLGLGSDANQLLNEIEALHLSPLYSKQSLDSLSFTSGTPSSSLDVIAYNTVLHAYSQSLQSFEGVNSAEKLFLAMKDQTLLNISIGESSVAILPPQPDFISYSSMLNCYCKHDRVKNAEALLNEMCMQKMQPNAACYLPIITSLEKASDNDVPERLMELMESSDKSLPRPNRAIYSAALRCLRRHGRGELAEIILDRYQKALPNSGPDIHSHLMVMKAWERTRSKEDRLEAAERAEIFFDGMQKKVTPSLLPKDVNAYNILLNCYARAGLHEKVEKQITDMEESFNVKPNNNSYSMLIKALSNSDSKYAVTFAWEVLYRLGYPRTVKEGEVKKVPDFNVSVDNLNSMLKLFAKRGMASDAEALLKDMDDMKMDDILTESPNIRSYESVLEALGKCEDIDAPARAEALITRLEVKAELGGDLQPSLLAYNSLLNIYGNAGSVGKAERLLEKLDGADAYSVASTIKAITNSGKSQLGSISLAKSLADELKFGNNEIIYANRLKLLAKFGLGNEAEELLERMKDHELSPSIIHYTSALNAWAKSKEDDSLSRAESLFKTMESKFDLDLVACHGLLLNYSTRGKAKKARLLLQQILHSSLEPTRSTFTMVIDSYARSKAPNAGQKAEELLNQMIELHAAGNRGVEPDNVTYASVIRAMKGKKKIKDLESFDKISLMQSLQLESWPFEEALI